MIRLMGILAFKALILGWLMGMGYIGLSPDEAQYWTWSQALDWGYYSKPPAIAWQIAATSFLLGNTVLGVRFGALMIGFVFPLIIYGAARAAKLKQESAFWAAVAAAMSPLGVYISFFATTDGGAILFLTLAITLLMKDIDRAEGPNYWLMGGMICLGALYKWTAFVFWPLLLLYLVWFKNLRKWSLLGGILLSLFALIPTVYWNWSHDWATFKHVGRAIGEVKQGNPIDFFVAQLGLLSPIFFIFFLMGILRVWRSERPELAVAAGFSSIIIIYLVASFFKKMQPNWAAYLYPMAFVLLAWVTCEVSVTGKKWIKRGVIFSVGMVAAAFSVVQLHSLGLAIPYTLHPFRQTVGWDDLAPALQAAGYRPEQDFLFGDKYQTASLLSFYSPTQKRAYFFNLSDSRNNQFSYWPQMNPCEIGHTGYFTVLENIDETQLTRYQEYYQNVLAPYFESVSCCGSYPLYWVAHKPVKYAIVFEAKNYLGSLPPESKMY